MPYHGIGKCRDKCMHLFTYCTLLGVVVYFAFRIAEGLIINIFCYFKYDLYQYSWPFKIIWFGGCVCDMSYLKQRGKVIYLVNLVHFLPIHLTQVDVCFSYPSYSCWCKTGHWSLVAQTSNSFYLEPSSFGAGLNHRMRAQTVSADYPAFSLMHSR